MSMYFFEVGWSSSSSIAVASTVWWILSVPGRLALTIRSGVKMAFSPSELAYTWVYPPQRKINRERIKPDTTLFIAGANLNNANFTDKLRLEIDELNEY